jgi:chemotaxis protein MotB
MKRFLCSGLKISSVLLMGLLLSGCVSQGKYDELKFAQRNCEAERERLSAELAGARNTIRGLEAEIARLKDLLRNREDIITALKQQLGGTDKALRDMTEIYKKLAERGPAAPLAFSPLPRELSNALQQFAKNHPGLVTYDEQRGVLKFTSDLVFDLGSADVKPEVVPALQEFAKIMDMQDAANFDAVIVGHTDNVRIGKPETRAKHPTNWHLSVHRSISVLNILGDAGVAPTRMGVMGYGEFRPIADNTTAENRAKNRRVEIYIVPKTGIGEKSYKSLDATGGESVAPAPETSAEEVAPSVEK